MYQQAINTRRESDRERLLVSSYAYAVSEENACGIKLLLRQHVEQVEFYQQCYFIVINN